jgi:dienelactone hydrolase
MIVRREVTYEVDGLRMIAHLAQPNGPGPWPAVLIGHDGVGLDDYQRQRADDPATHGIVLELARAGVPFKALAVVHPALPEARAEDWIDAGGPFLLCTGSEDPLCTPEQLLTFGRALQAAGVDWPLHIYGGAKHAFWARPRNPDGSLAEGANHTMATVPGVGYHPKHTPRAWQAVLDLFGETF